MKKSLALFVIALAAVLNAATPSTSLVYKNTTTNALTGNIVAGNNTTISASGNGTITATALTGNITGNPTISGNLTVGGGTATISGSSGYLKLTSTTASKTWDLFADNSGPFIIAHSGVVNALQINPTTGNTYVTGQLRSSSNIVASNLGSANTGFYGTAGTDAGSGHRLALVRTDAPSGGSALLSAFGGAVVEVNAATGINTGTVALTIDTSANATFAGQVNILNSNSYVKADSSNLVYETYAGKGHQFKTGGTTALTLDSSQNATFAGFVSSNQGYVAKGTISIPSAAYASLESSGSIGYLTSYNGAGSAYLPMTYRASLHSFTEGDATFSGQVNSGTSTSSGYNNNYNVQLEGASGRLIVNKNSASSSGTIFAGFGRGGSGLGSITQDGTSGVLYNTTSDARLKENVRDVTNSGAIIDGLKPRVFDWKNDGDKDRFGFLAQEVHAVFPQAVKKGDDGEEVTDAWAMDAAKLVPVLVAELKALRARVAALEAARN